MTKVLISVSLLMLLVFSGCRTLDVGAVNSDLDVSMNNPDEKEIIGTFAREYKNHVLFYNILTLKQEDKVSQIIGDSVKELGGSGAVNVRIRKQVRFLDYVLALITGGLYSPETVYLKGGVVK